MGLVPRKGRPPLDPETYARRVREYCARYDVEPTTEGLPPFPSGRRETAQHREWMSLYRLRRRRLERAARGDRPRAGGGALCPVCLAEPPASGHACDDLIRLATAAGPEALDRLRAHLWGKRRRRPA
jgi:hypothetical protein